MHAAALLTVSSFGTAGQPELDRAKPETLARGWTRTASGRRGRTPGWMASAPCACGAGADGCSIAQPEMAQTRLLAEQLSIAEHSAPHCGNIRSLRHRRYERRILARSRLPDNTDDAYRRRHDGSLASSRGLSLTLFWNAPPSPKAAIFYAASHEAPPRTTSLRGMPPPESASRRWFRRPGRFRAKRAPDTPH